MNRPVGFCITQNSRNPRISSAYKLYAFYYFYIVVLSVSVCQKKKKKKKKKNIQIINIQTKHFFMEIINTFKQSIAKIFDGTTVFVSCKTYTAMRYKKTTRRHNI